MRPLGIIKGKIPADPGAGFGNAGISPEVDLFVFDRPLQTLDKDVVLPGAAAVHADLDVSILQDLRERGRCELATLDALLNITQRFVSDLSASVTA